MSLTRTLRQKFPFLRYSLLRMAFGGLSVKRTGQMGDGATASTNAARRHASNRSEKRSPENADQQCYGPNLRRTSRRGTSTGRRVDAPPHAALLRLDGP
jgi:hypothetical protein